MEVSVQKPGSPEEVLAHFGAKGMKWGVRKSRQTSKQAGGVKAGKIKRTGRAAKGVGKATGRGLDNALFEISTKDSTTRQTIGLKAAGKLTKDLPGIQAKHGAYGKLRNRAKHPFSPEAQAYRADVKKAYIKRLEESANELTNVRGTRQYTLVENGNPNTKQYNWTVSTKSVKHADDGSFTVRPIFDDEGWIVKIEVVEDDMAQTMDRGFNFLIHLGIDVSGKEITTNTLQSIGAVRVSDILED